MPKKLPLTHWLQSPNKNYLGHADLPGGQDLVLTIKSAGWEDVKNPASKSVESKRVVHFEEDFKPLICNATNAKSIFKSVGEGQMEKAAGKRIKLSVGRFPNKITGEEEDCVRVKVATQEELRPDKITSQQAQEIEALLEAIAMDKAQWCKSLKITEIVEVPAVKFGKIITRLKELKNGQS